MTLEDHETGQDIINPYITIFSYPGEKYWVAMNTSTFGNWGQRNLLNIIDEKHFMQQKCWEDNKWYKVCAVIAKQDHPYDWNDIMPWIRGVRANGANDAIAIVPLGYLKEDYIKKNFLKTFQYFEECKKEEAGEHIPKKGPKIDVIIKKLD